MDPAAAIAALWILLLDLPENRWPSYLPSISCMCFGNCSTIFRLPPI